METVLPAAAYDETLVNNSAGILHTNARPGSSLPSHLQLNSSHVLAHDWSDDSCELLHVHPNLRVALTIRWPPLGPPPATFNIGESQAYSKATWLFPRLEGRTDPANHRRFSQRYRIQRSLMLGIQRRVERYTASGTHQGPLGAFRGLYEAAEALAQKIGADPDAQLRFAPVLISPAPHSRKNPVRA